METLCPALSGWVPVYAPSPPFGGRGFYKVISILIFNMTIIKKRGRIKMKNNLNLVIVGGAAAGPTAASTAQRKDPKAEIILLEKGNFISYSA